jgi:hypothetical protein
MGDERELTGPVDLCDARGRLNAAARGWSRVPMLRANLRGAHGRKKRWDYWCVMTPEVTVALVYADVDYAGLAGCWVLDAADQRETKVDTFALFGRGFALPEQVCTGTAAVSTRALSMTITETPGATHLRAAAPSTRHGRLEVELTVDKPAGHESLNVVIPWSDERFQFTSKQNTRPARGAVSVGDRRWTIGDDAWAVQDLGRGIWPYANRWNWAAASGRSADGRLVGLQFGGKWTEGTGYTENALCLDGRLSKIGEELEWRYDWDHPLRPWRVRSRGSSQVDVTLTPTFDRRESVDLKLLKMEVHQCFGAWSGAVTGDDGRVVTFDNLRGFAEETRNRW